MKKFIRENIDHQPIVDNVFKIVSLANDAIAKKRKRKYCQCDNWFII